MSNINTATHRRQWVIAGVDVIRRVSPDTPRADVCVRIKTPVKTMPAASRPPVMSEDALKDLQVVTAFMKGKQTG